MELTFALLGIIVLLGVGGSMLFARTQIPDLMGLILVGILLGPVLGLVSPDQLAPVTPYFATLAMIIILFEGGVGLNLKSLLRGAAGGFAFALTAFVLSVAGVAATAVLFGYQLQVGILLGAILGGTSGAIVLPLLLKFSASEETKTVLAIESALTDVLCLVVALTLINMLGRAGNAAQASPLVALGANFSVGLILGVGCGVAWLKLLPRLEHHALSYMLTLAALFLLYSGAQVMGGSGAMASLSFGLVLGNNRSFDPEASWVSEEVRRRLLDFHSEVAFFVRTFFFVYIGLIFDTRLITVSSAAFAAAAFAAILGARWLAVTGYCRLRPGSRPERGVLYSMMARGLAAAVLAPLPLAMGVPQSEAFNEVALIVLVASNLALTVGAVTLSMRRRRQPQPEAAGR